MRYLLLIMLCCITARSAPATEWAFGESALTLQVFTSEGDSFEVPGERFFRRMAERCTEETRASRRFNCLMRVTDLHYLAIRVRITHLARRDIWKASPRKVWSSAQEYTQERNKLYKKFMYKTKALLRRYPQTRYVTHVQL